MQAQFAGLDLCNLLVHYPFRKRAHLGHDRTVLITRQVPGHSLQINQACIQSKVCNDAAIWSRWVTVIGRSLTRSSKILMMASASASWLSHCEEGYKARSGSSSFSINPTVQLQYNEYPGNLVIALAMRALQKKGRSYRNDCEITWNLFVHYNQ